MKLPSLLSRSISSCSARPSSASLRAAATSRSSTATAVVLTLEGEPHTCGDDRPTASSRAVPSSRGRRPCGCRFRWLPAAPATAHQSRAAVAAARQGDGIGLEAEAVQRRNAGVDRSARQHHQLRPDAASFPDRGRGRARRNAPRRPRTASDGPSRKPRTWRRFSSAAAGRSTTLRSARSAGSRRQTRIRSSCWSFQHRTQCPPRRFGSASSISTVPRSRMGVRSRRRTTRREPFNSSISSATSGDESRFSRSGSIVLS